MLEKDVILQVLERDKNAADSIIDKVKDEFEKMTGIKCNIKIAKTYLPAKCIGGCTLYNKKCTVKVTNSISERFKIILHNIAVSKLRYMLFGKNENRKFLV